MSKPNTTTTTQAKAAAGFLAAYNALLVATTATRAKADKDLDAALATYRKAHDLTSAFGFLDCINHYNATHATAEPEPVKVVEQPDARRAWRDQVRAYRKAKAEGTLPPATPQAEIRDVGGYDLNGNPL